MILPLRASAVSGVKWTGASAVLTAGLQFLQMSVLARLLQPDDFGLMGMVMVTIGFAQAFADLGVSNAVIHRQDVTDAHLSTLYWLNILCSAGVFGLVAGASPWIADFYGEPRLTRLIGWTAMIFPVTAVGHLFQMLLQKTLRFERLARVEVMAVAAGTAVAVVSAIYGQGVFSLIWGQLASAGVRTCGFVAMGWRTWRPGLRFRRGDLTGYLRFGAYQMGERSINYLSSNMDYVVIGRFLGTEVLGAYVLAYQLVILPISRINPILTRVAFPVFARRQADDASLRRGYLEMSRLLGFALFPVLIGLGVTSPIFVPLFLGSGWESTVHLVRILALVGISRGLGNPLGSILLAKGRVGFGFLWNAIALAVYTTAFWTFAQEGVYAVAWSYAVLSATIFTVGQVVLRGMIGLNVRAYFSGLSRSLAMGAAMGGLLLAAMPTLGRIWSDDLVLQLVLTALGVCLYGLFAFAFERPFLREMWGWMTRGAVA